jgi:peptidoglycan hydrolase-like protein with peptidoglycan-binding domain
MSQKLFKILLISVLTIGLVILGVILVRAQNKKDALEIQTNIENPFGINSEDTSLGNGNNSAGGNNNSEEGGESGAVPVQVDFISNEDSPVVQKISEEPVAGATFTYIQRDIILPEEVSANLVEGYDFSGYPTLKFGDDRKEVVDLKTVLNRQDPSPALEIDNAFDTALKNAVIEFQAQNGLTPDGVVGPMMYKKLNDFQGIVPKVTKAPEKETVEIIRFVDRANGYIFDKAIKPNEPLKRVTSSQIARVYEAYFDNTKSIALLRYLKDATVENIVAKIKKPEIISGNSNNYSTLETKLLSNSITFVSPISSGLKMFYLAKQSSGVDGVVYDFKTGSTKKIWSSKFSEWIPQAVSENIISLTTRASGRYPGNSYILDIKNNSLRNIISEVEGLTTNVSPDGKKVIFSSFENGTLKTSLMNISTGQISDFSPTTLPEKCVWTKDSKTIYCGGPSNVPLATYPDDWYKGEVLFSDILWKIDVDTNTSKILLDGNKITTPIDITSSAINDKQDYFIFINKHDMNLYGVDLSRL